MPPLVGRVDARSINPKCRITFYSSYKGNCPRCWIHVLSKGDMVLDDLDRRLEAAGGPKARIRSRLSPKRIDVRTVRGVAAFA